MNRRITALTIAAVAVLGLTSCAATPSTGGGTAGSSEPSASASQAPEASGGSESDSDSSTGGGDSSGIADACAVIGQAITDATAGMEGVEPSADPQAAIDAMNASAEAIGAAISDIDNEEVAAAAKGLQEGFAGIAEATAAVMGGDVTKAAELETLSTEFEESFTAFQELCVQ
ncbi:hypothetical protein ACPW96_07345 [Micromonospora sp. DT81.3]|uniref:hypothetical protein n=1 Tax=Micromonospora sp. DT81.3 TaxID=3416523 RepID=UPI003CED6D7C